MLVTKLQTIWKKAYFITDIHIGVTYYYKNSKTKKKNCQ